MTATALGLGRALQAQELEPRSYSASPVGASFFVTGISNNKGAVLLDATIPIANIHASINALFVGFGHTFAIGSKQALFTAAIPYAWGPLTGTIDSSGVDSSVWRQGIGDLRAKVSVNFIGSPALTPAEFTKRKPSHLIVGASLLFSLPTGQNFSNKLINIGANRWAFKPEVGVSYNWSAKLYLDFYAGVWLFGNNASAYPGTATLSQDPLVSLQLHASYTFRPRFFVAIESTWYNGGESHLNGGPPSTRTDNSRIGLLASYGFTATQSVKLNYASGATARAGTNFKTWMLAYQLLWF